MSRSDPQVNIRMPQALKERLEQACRESGRSLNAEIVHRLLGSEKPNLREIADSSTIRIPLTVDESGGGDKHNSPDQGCAHEYVRSDRICIECGERSNLRNGDTSYVQNCAETQTGGFLELHAQINRLQEEVIAKGLRLSFMFDMHQEFMQRYEDLVRDRDNWQVLAEKNNGR